MSAFDPGAGTSVWDGPVLLDAGPMGSPAAITMTGPIDGDGYTRLAATLGGGAVGLVPFQTHTSDCFPAAFVAPSASFTLHPNSAPAPSKPIVIRHFGPVRLPELPDTAFTIEARLLDEPDSWVDVTSCFTESLDVPGTAVLLTPTNLLPGGFEYRVIQNKDEKGDNLLLCDLPDPLRPQAPVVDFPLEFRFEVCDEVPLGDASSDGIVNFADITAVLANFNATGCLLLGDANKDGVVNFADITEVLADFNFVYCGNVAQSVGAKGGVAANHMDLGEEAPMSAADAANMVLSALAAMGYPSIEAFADAFAQMRAAEQTAEIQQLGQLLQGSP